VERRLAERTGWGGHVRKPRHSRQAS